MVTKYSDIVTIKGGKSAYIIQDEQGTDWTTFIANEQFNGILRKVIASVRNDDIDNHKSFWITGTYGTGKSHAGAIIKHLLCDEVDDIISYINEQYVGTKYEGLRNDIFKLRDQKRLFPIMLYGRSSISHEDDLSPTLHRAIGKALEKEPKLSNISVRTDFDNHVKHIKSDVEFWTMLIDGDPKLKSVAPTIQKLISKLEDLDTNTLGKVRDALRKRKHDILFDNDNLSQWFFEVQKELADKTEYNGLLVIWDEFTDVINSDIGPNLLVVLQEINEKIMNPENNSYFLYISHPSVLNSLGEYEREKTKGRYHYMGYNMEPVSAFKIMSCKFKVINDNETLMQKLRADFYNGKQDLLDSFSKESTNPEEIQSDVRKLFPLHPSTANLAIYYAREVGSSSRSVFQFLGENDAIKQFLNDERHFSNKNTITADYLWDYVLEEFNIKVEKFGAVTERFNSRKNQIEQRGSAHLAVFKGILLLNALNNIANNETVTPSEENIRNLFVGTVIENKLESILNYINENGIIQQMAGLFSIQNRAFPIEEIESLKNDLRQKQFKLISQVVNFGETAKKEIETFLNKIMRPHRFFLYSEDINEHTLLNKIEQDYKQSNSYEIFMALLFARNANELNIIKNIAERTSKEERFQNTVFIAFESTFTDNRYDQFIEYQANATYAQKYGYANEYKIRIECVSKMIKEWIIEIRKGIFSYYIRERKGGSATAKIVLTINEDISLTIFSKGPESLSIIRNRPALYCWKKMYVKQAAENILGSDDKTEIREKCQKRYPHIVSLLQDSVNEELEWVYNINKKHPLYLVCEFINEKFNHAVKKRQFNLGDELIDLSKPPFGLFQSAIGIGMVAFAMRKYVNQIYDPQGKARSPIEIVEDIMTLFRAWEGNKTSKKLDFCLETQESKNVCEYLIDLFKLYNLGYNNISSLADTCQAITYEYSQEQGYPLWALKYSIVNEGIKALIDNIFKICSEENMQKNPNLLNKTIEGFEKYKFEMGNLLVNNPNAFKDGFVCYLQSIDDVNLQDNEVDEAYKYIRQHSQGNIGLWTESKVEKVLIKWKLQNQEDGEQNSSSLLSRIFGRKQKNQEEENKNDKINKPIDSDEKNKRRIIAINKVHSINDIQKFKELLKKICESGDERILEIISNYNV